MRVPRPPQNKIVFISVPLSFAGPDLDKRQAGAATTVSFSLYVVVLPPELCPLRCPHQVLCGTQVLRSTWHPAHGTAGCSTPDTLKVEIVVGGPSRQLCDPSAPPVHHAPHAARRAPRCIKASGRLADEQIEQRRVAHAGRAGKRDGAGRLIVRPD